MQGLAQPVGAGFRWLSCALAFCALAPAARVVHRPYIQNLRQDRVTVIWSTRENVPGVVEYSADQSFSQTATARTRAFPPSETRLSFTFYQHTAELTGLSPGVQYNYRVITDGENIAAEADHRFRTAGAGPFSFLVFGDNGQGTPDQLAMTLRIANERPNLVLLTGDVVYTNGTFEEFLAYYFDYYWTVMRRAAFFPSPGNHDYYTDNAGPYLALHSLPNETVPVRDRGRYYSFDWGDVHFVALDTSPLLNDSLNSGMLDWLENDLASTRAPWRIVYFHHTPYPITHHLNDTTCAAVRERIVPVLERHGVQLVLSGHEHSYQRTRPMRSGRPVVGPGTVYVTTGGAGAVLHPVAQRDFLAKAESAFHYLRGEVNGPAITIRAIRFDGREIDRFSLSLPSLRAANPAVNVASFTPALAPGSVLSLFGSGLAGETLVAAAAPLPTE
ncbi:MAG: metallophosphoesterase, partial [Bryobacteraceae bacterium]